ncbi:Rgg/GadR/MutR family transcriptional regulator [Miniphocaeibacter massiliensis]|uniref:Rgg/GadR/MutR family transcriptional regulator n=1 Tax=Miniphocaeibacter massiliensis TaxID=2041841 RepID=UPI000C088D4C|nr:Rgg/GadR/MutR family transcriptional regulator [Miniphocaeibacter massiliensis]
MTTKEVADNIVSVQFLRRFEKDENDIKFSNFHELLNKINVTYDEFMSDKLINDSEDSVEKIELTIDFLGIKKDYLGIQKLIDKYEKKHLEKNESRYLHYAILIKIYSNLLCKTSYEIDVNTIQEYLSKCDVWYTYEFFIATYCLGYFNDNAIKSMVTTLPLHIIKNKNTRIYQLDYMLHLIMELLNRNFLYEAENLLENYENNKNEATALQYMPFHTFSVFLEGLVLIKKGDENGIKKCEEIINLFSEVLGYKEYANMIFEYYMKTKNNSPLKK